MARTDAPPAAGTDGRRVVAGDPRLWVDLCSPSHPFLFRGILDAFDGIRTAVTVRRKTETIPLAEELGFRYQVVGTDFDNRWLRMAGIPLRALQLSYRMPACDVALCSRNAMAIIAAATRGVPSIHFTDNDITAHVDGLRVEQLYNRFEARATHNVVPAAFETRELTRWGATPDSVHTYDGTKEDVYVAAFEPDPGYAARLPFEEYVVVRPEAMGAAYVDIERSLVPELLSRLTDRGHDVVYLPRGRGDEGYADAYPDDRVYAPEAPLNGLQLAWHANCVLTGSGTMAREAAAMGKPAVSFFPNRLLSVDERLAADGRVYHSREPAAIADYVDETARQGAAPDRSRSFRVRSEVASLVADLIEREA